MNGLQDRHRAVDEERPTERTALLSRAAADPGGEEDDQDTALPPIDPIVARLQAEGLPADYSWCPDTLSLTARTGFILVTLLQLRNASATQSAAGPADDSWEQWSRRREATHILHDTEKQIAEIWTRFLEDASQSEEVERVLWRKFRLKNEDNGPCVRREYWSCLQYLRH